MILLLLHGKKPENIDVLSEDTDLVMNMILPISQMLLVARPEDGDTDARDPTIYETYV